MPSSEPVAIALGSNLGNSLATLTWAVSALKTIAEGGVLRCSPWFRSAAVGGPPNQPDYINGVVLLHCSGSPMALLQRLQALERQAGRRPGPRWGPRVLDLGGSGVETDSVDSGLSLHLLPRLVPNGGSHDVQLSLNLMQNKLIGFKRFEGVELPEFDSRMISSQLLLKPGETLVLSGYEQDRVQTGGGSGLLYTGRTGESHRTALVVIVRVGLTEA